MQKYKKNTILYTLLIMLAVFAIVGLGTGMGSLLAYFTASANANGKMDFANLELNLTRGGSELTSDIYTSTYMADLMPGSKITMNDITINNTGDIPCYALINYQLNISKDGVNEISYSTWYNLDGELVNSANLSSNTTKSTTLNVGDSKSLNLYYVLSGEVITDSYQGATVTTTLTACAIQTTNIGIAASDENKELSAVSIIKNLIGGNWGTSYTLTIICDGKLGNTTYQVTGGATIGQVLNSNGVYDKYTPYITCGFFTEEEYLDCLNEDTPLWEDITLYTKTATLDKLLFVNSGTYYSAKASGTANSDGYNTSVTDEVVFPCYYDENGNNNGLPVTEIYKDSAWDSGGFFRCINITNFVFSTTFTNLATECCDYVSITDLKIHSNFKSIGGAFSYVKTIQTIKVSKFNSFYEDLGCNSVYSKKDRALMIASNNSVIAEGTLAISTMSYGRRQLNGIIVFPESLKRIAGFVFTGDKINNVRFTKNINEIGNYAFRVCETMTNIIIDSSYVYNSANGKGDTICGGIMNYATEVRVLVDIDNKSNTYLSDTNTFTVNRVGNYNVYTKIKNS